MDNGVNREKSKSVFKENGSSLEEIILYITDNILILKSGKSE